MIKINVINVDINECERDTDNCDNNAICTDTEGSFYCNCSSGYNGTGVSCQSMLSCLVL